MTLRERLDALMAHSAQEVEPAASVRAYREFATACAEAYRAGLLVPQEVPLEPRREPAIDATPWVTFRCVLPRNIGGVWHWFSLAERRTVYPHGALGILTGSIDVEYRKCRV